ncbi:hypothetical protein EDB19DRAFT_1685396, partial [Suillus lakei]
PRCRNVDPLKILITWQKWMALLGHACLCSFSHVATHFPLSLLVCAAACVFSLGTASNVLSLLISIHHHSLLVVSSCFCTSLPTFFYLSIPHVVNLGNLKQ